MEDKTKTINLLEAIYNTLQQLEIKGEANCSYIVGTSTAIKQYIKELKSLDIE